jgi:4-amino-4-deoxy-L-arabinose transferase-like glycosyltransferase
MSPRRQLSVLVVLVLVKAVLLLVVLPAFSKPLKSIYGTTFADDYDKLAGNLEAGRGYRLLPEAEPTLMREPGYPLFLAAVFRVGGRELAAARVANLLLGLATAVVVLRLATDLGLSVQGSLFAAVLFLIYPGTLVAESRGGFESLFTLLLAGFVLLWGRAVANDRSPDYAAAGVVLGLAGLVRTTVVLLPVLAFGWLWLRPPRRVLHALGRAAVLGGAMLVVVSPWIIRNSLLTGEPTWATTVRGTSAHAGQYICLHRGDPRGLQAIDLDAADERAELARQWGYRFKFDYYLYFYTTKDEIEFDRRLMGTVGDRWRAHPLLAAGCAVENLGSFWFAGKNARSTALNVATQLPLMLLAAGGVIALARKGRAGGLVPMGIVVGYLLLLHSIVIAQARYSVPLVPFLAVCASAAVFARRTSPSS